MSRRGRFIVLEGIDGAGTTTQAEAIARTLRQSGLTVHVTCEPSKGPVGAMLRDALSRKLRMTDATLALLFAADRLHHLSSEVQPALERGETVVCDRYVLSSLAYQGASLPMAWVASLNSKAIRPDLTLFIEVPPEVAAERRARRGGEAELFDDERRQRLIARAYGRAMALRKRSERIVRIDGTRPIGEVTAEAMKEIRKLWARFSRS